MPQAATYFEFHGARLINSRLISPAVRREIETGHYEGDEIACVLQTIRPDDIVLELGAGIGALSAVVMKRKPAHSWVCVEANPDLAPLIRKNHKLNDIAACTVLTGVLSRSSRTAEYDFYVPEDFWAASLQKPAGQTVAIKKTPALPANDLLADISPTFVICDIEGGEYDLFAPGLDLSSVRKICLEVHAAGPDELAALHRFFTESGFSLVAGNFAPGVVFMQREGREGNAYPR